MNYKKEMKKMMQRREEYFPAFEFLLGLYNRRSEYTFPVLIEDVRLIALIIELMDIGYLDRDSFMVKKRGGDVDALYYNGGYPLTEKGLLMERAHLHSVRGRYIKLAVILSLLLLAAVIYFMIF